MRYLKILQFVLCVCCPLQKFRKLSHFCVVYFLLTIVSSAQATSQPSSQPSRQPSNQPSQQPSQQPSSHVWCAEGTYVSAGGACVLTPAGYFTSTASSTGYKSCAYSLYAGAGNCQPAGEDTVARTID